MEDHDIPHLGSPDMRAVEYCQNNDDGRWVCLIVHGKLAADARMAAFAGGAEVHSNQRALNFPGGSRLILFDLAEIGARDRLRAMRFRAAFYPEDTSVGDVALLNMLVRDPDEQLSRRERRRRSEVPVKTRDPLT